MFTYLLYLRICKMRRQLETTSGVKMWVLTHFKRCLTSHSLHRPRFHTLASPDNGILVWTLCSADSACSQILQVIPTVRRGLETQVFSKWPARHQRTPTPWEPCSHSPSSAQPVSARSHTWNQFKDFLLDAKLKDPVDTLLTVCHHAEDTRCNNEPTWANKVQTFTNSCTVCYASCNTLELSYAYCISLGCLQSIEQCKYTSIHIYKYQSIIIHVQGDFFNWDPQFQYQKENRDISQS